MHEQPEVIADLTLDPANARVHSERNIAMITGSIEECGFGRSVLIDEAGVLIAGNATTQAAARAGLSKVRVIDTEGDEIIAVRRRGLSDAQKAKLALFDNRAAELATGWSAEALQALQAQGVDLTNVFTSDELQDVYAEAALVAAKGEGRSSPDAIIEKRATDIVEGDMFDLGTHRIVCGDSTAAAVVERVLAGTKPVLMVTDPPYGIAYDPTWRNRAGVNKSTKKSGKVLNDDQADWTEVWRLFPGDVAYVWHAGLKSAIVQASLELAKFTLRAQIIWAKDRLALSRGDYHWQHEPCWYAVREGKKGHRNADRSQATLWRLGTPASWLDLMPAPEQTTVWDIPSREDGGHGHGTQKPVECMARPMRNHRAPEVFEPFAGSGTTLIAGQMLGRRVYAIELDPSYVQMTIDRWEAFSGKVAVKVAEAVRG